MQLQKIISSFFNKRYILLSLLVFFVKSNVYSQQNINLLGKFNVSVEYMDKLISNKITGDEFYKIIEKSIISWNDKTYIEFNDKTCEHNLQVYSPECTINYNGSTIYVSFKCDSASTKPINSITVGFNCGCTWFDIKNEAQNTGYKHTEYTDRPDKIYKGVLGGLQIKFTKADKQLFYHKYHTKTYFEFSIDKAKQKELLPKTSIDYLERAKSKIKCNDNKTMEYVNKAIELNPNYSDAYLFRALLRFNAISDNKEYVEGSQTWVTMIDINRAIQIDSNNISAYFLRAKLFGVLQDYNKGIDDLSKVLSLNNNFDEAFIYRASYKTEIKDVKGAIDDLNQTLSKNPKNIEALTERAILYFQLKDYNSSCKDFKLAKELGLSTSGRLDLLELLKKCN